MVIRILDYVRSASTYDDGDKIFRKLLDPIVRNERVVIDFDGISSVPSAFVNAALVRLLEHVSFQQVRDHLVFANSTRQINDLVRRRFDFVASGTSTTHYILLRTGALFHFLLKAGNSETILSSERYTSKAGAENGIASVRANSSNDARYTRLTSRDNKPYFMLKAANGEIIGTSETYSSAAARDNGIESCKTNGPTAPTVDKT